MATVYLRDYVHELRTVGQVVFRRRHTTPVLIVTGRAGELIESRTSVEATMISARSPSFATDLALLHRVFPIMKAAHAPRGPVAVGRTSDNDVPIPEYSISKRHCLFEFDPAGVKLFDCGSTNGTFLDGRSVDPKQPVPLKGGEVITLGRFAFLFQTALGFLEYIDRLAEKTDQGYERS